MDEHIYKLSFKVEKRKKKRKTQNLGPPRTITFSQLEMQHWMARSDGVGRQGAPAFDDKERQKSLNLGFGRRMVS